MPKEEGDAVREYKVMHAENFLSSWLREDGREKEVRTVKVSEENEDERGEKRKREEVKSSVKGEIYLESWVVFLGGTWRRSLRTWSEFEPDTRVEVRVVLDVTGVLVSPSSVVIEFCDGFSCCSGWE